MSAKTERSFQVFASVAPQAKSRTGVATGVFTGTRALQSNRFLPCYAVWSSRRLFSCLLLVLSLLIAVLRATSPLSFDKHLAVSLLCKCHWDTDKSETILHPHSFRVAPSLRRHGFLSTRSTQAGARIPLDAWQPAPPYGQRFNEPSSTQTRTQRGHRFAKSKGLLGGQRGQCRAASHT